MYGRGPDQSEMRRGMKATIRTAASTSSPATTYRPAAALPVASRSQPTMNGAIQPERFPIELISAMPAAAPVPASIMVGIGQKGANALSTPVTPSTSAANASGGACANAPIDTSPAAAATHDSAQ